jgi:hypothetical protein
VQPSGMLRLSCYATIVEDEGPCKVIVSASWSLPARTVCFSQTENIDILLHNISRMSSRHHVLLPLMGLSIVDI